MGDVVVENVEKTFESIEKYIVILAIITQITPINGRDVSISFKSFRELLIDSGISTHQKQNKIALIGKRGRPKRETK